MFIEHLLFASYYGKSFNSYKETYVISLCLAPLYK